MAIKKLTEHQNFIPSQGINDNFRSELNEVLHSLAEKYGLTFISTNTVERSNNAMYQIRFSEIDLNGSDALRTDLLNFHEQFGFKASILTSIFKIENCKYQISGFDTVNKRFRVTSEEGGTNFYSFEEIKAILPGEFYE